MSDIGVGLAGLEPVLCGIASGDGDEPAVALEQQELDYQRMLGKQRPACRSKALGVGVQIGIEDEIGGVARESDHRPHAGDELLVPIGAGGGREPEHDGNGQHERETDEEEFVPDPQTGPDIQ